MNHNNNLEHEHSARNDEHNVEVFESNDDSVLDSLSLKMTKQVDRNTINHKNTMDKEKILKGNVKESKEKLPALRGKKDFFSNFPFILLHKIAFI